MRALAGRTAGAVAREGGRDSGAVGERVAAVGGLGAVSERVGLAQPGASRNGSALPTWAMLPSRRAMSETGSEAWAAAAANDRLAAHSRESARLRRWAMVFMVCGPSKAGCVAEAPRCL
ncbi:hypothetical protein AU476_33980 [Cupriavidus sp. UYMSc13B]|nr:hypothetical protein AU476_33980 [Cupriavidus sp. UYMSc13B]